MIVTSLAEQAALADPAQPHLFTRTAPAMVGVARLARGIADHWEQHDGGDEVFVIIAGGATLHLHDRQSVEVKAGDLVLVPRGVAHSFELATDELHLLYVTPLEGNRGWGPDGEPIRRHA